MSDYVSNIILSLLSMAVFAMFFGLCLKPIVGSMESAGITLVYIWLTILVLEGTMADSPMLLHVVVNLLMVIAFFIAAPQLVGTMLHKAFVYASAWMFSLVSSSFSAFSAAYLERWFPLGDSLWELCIKGLSLACIYLFVRWKLSRACGKMFTVFNRRFPPMLTFYPMLIILSFVFFIPGFDSRTNLSINAVFYLLFTALSICGYVLILQNAMEILERQRAEADLEFARQIVKEQKSHYTVMLESIETLRIQRHDYLMHVRALLCLKDKPAADDYLRKLLCQYQQPVSQKICENRFINDLMSLYAKQCEQEGIELNCAMSIPADIEIDEMDLCTVVGNLMQNAIDACARLQTGRYIHVNARYESEALTLMIKNSFDGIVLRNGNRVMSRKRNGGIGLLSIQRITDAQNNDFDFVYDERSFTAMITLTAKSSGARPG